MVRNEYLQNCTMRILWKAIHRGFQWSYRHCGHFGSCWIAGQTKIRFEMSLNSAVKSLAISETILSTSFHMTWIENIASMSKCWCVSFFKFFQYILIFRTSWRVICILFYTYLCNLIYDIKQICVRKPEYIYMKYSNHKIKAYIHGQLS